MKARRKPAHAVVHHTLADLVELDRALAAGGAHDLPALRARFDTLAERLCLGGVGASDAPEAWTLCASLRATLDRWADYAAPAANVVHVDFKARRRGR